MTFYPEFTVADDGSPMLWVRLRAEGDGVVGDGGFEITPGETRAGLNYDAWATLARDNRSHVQPA